MKYIEVDGIEYPLNSHNKGGLLMLDIILKHLELDEDEDIANFYKELFLR